jgi:LuxR family transcriptional regulator, maltose regulon positive regulatory protein
MHTTPLGLLLDDYHVINAQVIHEALTFLVDHLPPQIHLIITSRIDPPLPLERWRVRNQLVDVRADDLRFTPQESATFLNDVMGLTLSPTEITALETRTEGWIAGLQLAALSMQGRADVTGFIQSFSGSNRHVLSYLVEEVLNRRPPDTLNFLLQSSILDRMCAPLCDAVTGETEGQASLAKLEQANLFLIPLDDEGKWYRYHHLFAEVLRTRLQQTQPAIIPQLHQRASEWYAAAGQLEQAVSHALAMPDIERAATLIERVALTTLLHQGDILLVRRLVDRLPLAVVYVRPYLTLAYGIALALTGQFAAIEQLLAHAAVALNIPDLLAPTLPTEVAGGITLLHATIARFRDDPDRALALAQQALQQLPIDSQIGQMLRAGAVLTRGSAYLQRGESLAGQQALAEAVALGLASGAGNLAMAAWEELATEQARQGRLAQTKRTCEQALTQVARWDVQMMPTASMAQIGIGEVLVEWNDLAGASQVLTQGLPLVQRTNETTMLARGYSALARCHCASGERGAAFTTLQQGEAWLTQMQIFAPRAHAWLAAQQARLQVWQGNLAAALQWEQETHPVGTTMLAYLQQLTRVRLRLAQAARNPQGRFLQEATHILTPLLSTAETSGWDSHVIEILLLQALLEQAQGKRVAAQTTLMRTLSLAEPEGYLRIFVDEGELLRLMILDFGFWIAKQVHLENRASLSAYANKLLALFPIQQPSDQDVVGSQPGVSSRSQNPTSKIQNLVDPLSTRELEVLQLVAAGLSNTEIAARLIVTTGTVKTHINHIFGKLGAESRIQVVVCARELGLLND